MSAEKPMPEDLPRFATTLARHLGVGVELDLDEILGLAGVAAHKVARPAAPVTTFLLGCAAAESPHIRLDLLRQRAQRFIDEWPDSSESVIDR
jgi:hypothetical protein